MSTRIALISGKYEIPNPATMTCNYGRSDLLVTSFWGGVNRGKCLQITAVEDDATVSYSQLTKEQVLELRDVLSAWLDNQ